MTENSAYSILGLSEEASKAEVKAAFKELSLKYHPDKHNNNEESTKKFIEIRAAYKAITDNKKSDNVISDSQNEDYAYKAEDDSFLKLLMRYFESEDSKKFEAQFTKDLSESGFKIKTYKLLEEGEFFTTKAKATYIAVRDCKSLAEIGLGAKISKNILQKIQLSGESLIAALKGAVASQDLNKFFEINTHIHGSEVNDYVGRHVIFNVIEEVLDEAQTSQIEESKLTTMIKYLIEDKALVANDRAIKHAAKGKFYDVAQYLIDHVSVTKDLSADDLFDYEGIKDEFEAFKWLKDHGIKIEKSTVAKVVCNDKLKPNYLKIPALKNHDNLELAKNFFAKENIASLEEISDIKQGCEFLVGFKNSFGIDDEYLNSAIRSNKISNVKILLDAGAKLKENSYHNLHYANPEMLGFIINQVDNIRMVYKEDNSKLLTKTILSASFDNVKALLDKGMPVYTNTYLSLEHTTPEIAEIVLSQMRSQKPTEVSLILDYCHNYEPSINQKSYDKFSYSSFSSYSFFYDIYCKKYSYNFSTPQDCQIGELVADYLGETDKIDWSVCQ